MNWRVKITRLASIIAVLLLWTSFVFAQSAGSVPNLPTTGGGLTDPNSADFNSDIFFEDFNSSATGSTDATATTTTDTAETTTTPATDTTSTTTTTTDTTSTVSTTPDATAVATTTTTPTTTPVSDVQTGPTDQLLFWLTFITVFSGVITISKRRKPEKWSWL